MGLPGAGKTTLAMELYTRLHPHILWLNADKIREEYNDWDFSQEGRLRQAQRMHDIAEKADNELFVMADFVAPLPEMRDIYDADFTIWVDTIKEGRFEDTNKAFIAPEKYDFKVTTQDAEYWAPIIIKEICK